MIGWSLWLKLKLKWSLKSMISPPCHLPTYPWNSLLNLIITQLKHGGFSSNLKLKLIDTRGTHPGLQPCPGTSLSWRTPAECHNSSGGLMTPSNTTYFFKWKFKCKLFVIKGIHQNCDQRPQPLSGTSSCS